jgi:hypothetical protein
MDAISKGLNEILIFLFMAGLLIGLAMWGIFAAIDKQLSSNDIKVSEPLIPKIELVIKNNKVDTLYVYKIK